ncbi:PBP1 and LysM peptidoglycan-binding domain-containing protein [Flavobacterium pallidum]|uniref:Peptidoglycan-binding protein n=1 Tax=Flavobacterium pallidum TaxID=2172098 RepID=A0A2S1SKD6_9FLAO|nr:LysM peptidoglycan-binding domain-containing protein [Flavobacterium pallidum]AWI26884.1 peptidoglycan-binding protein [Flavobacterium pallidum]
MRQLLVILAAYFMVSCAAFAQDKIIKHKVAKGETVTQIAEKYKITPAEIYRLNPDSQNGLKPDMVLLIPGGPKTHSKTAVTSITTVKTHTVAAKETLYGLSRTYGVSEEEILKANPGLTKDSLKVGQIINIPTKSDVKVVLKETKKDKKSDKKREPVYHTVVAGETKYSIARQYNTTVAQLDIDNPEIKNSLQIGFRLKVYADTNNTVQEVAVEEDRSVSIKPEIKKPEFVDYQVKPKETLYSLGRKFGMAQEELIKLNPELKEGVKEGMTIKYPTSVKVNETVTKSVSGLSKTLNTDHKKQLVLLLPFNISKIEGDTVNSTSARLKKDKFLNMTLDFYSGALMAVDSAKALNLNIDIKIYDSQETKNSSSVATLISQNNIADADVVIGPFYQANVEKAAELLQKKGVAVISPLSKETSREFPNLMQSMPSSELIKNEMLDFLRTKNANIMAIVDPKRLSAKQFFAQNHKDVKLVSLNEKGLFTAEILAKDFVKGKMNYVILDSEKTGLILNTLNVLIPMMADYQLQLVILEKNDTFDFEEVPLAKLAQLHLLYPSLTKDNDSAEAVVFEKDYKDKNKIFPNQYATRGFDVVFDAMLRLSQEKPFMETVETTSSEQVENRFDYEKLPSGTYMNKGFYILYYDTDLSVKEAN